MSNPVRVFLDFRRQELPVAVLLFVFFFLIIAVFQITKPLKDGLFVEHFGATVELYAKLLNIAIAAVAMLVFSYLYDRLGRQKLIYVLGSFFVFGFLTLHTALAVPDTLSIWSFYFLGDLVSTLLVVAFWAYLTDISTPEQAKRLFGPIGGGAVIGGWSGSVFAKILLPEIGMAGLLLLAAALMAAVILIIFLVESLVDRSSLFRTASGPKKQPLPGTAAALEGAQLVFRSRYLAAIVGIMGFYEIASQVMDYQFKLATESFSGVTATQAYMVEVRFYANILAVLVQFVVVPVVFKKFGLIPALFILPVSIITASAAFLAVPTLLVASLLVVFDNGLNYSIQQTARETLYVPTSPDEKYKARAFTSMFVQRFAKGAGIFAVLGLGTLGVTVGYLSLITIAVMLLVALCGIYAGFRFAEKSRQEEQRLAA